VAVNVPSCDLGAVCDVGTETNDPEVKDNAPEDVDSLPVGGVEADATALRVEQEQDPSLATCWSQAQAGKGGFVVHKGLLYHHNQVEGQARRCVSYVCPRATGIIFYSWLMSQCLVDTWESARPVRRSGYHFIGLDYVRLCCYMYSHVVNVSCTHVR